MEVSKKEARREARRNAILKNSKGRLRMIGNQIKNPEQTPEQDVSLAEEKEQIDSPLINPITCTTTPVEKTSVRTPTESLKPTTSIDQKQQQHMTALFPVSQSTLLLHRLVLHNRIVTLIRLVLPLITSLLVRQYNTEFTNLPILVLSVMNSVFVISIVLVMNRSKSSHQDLGWLDFLPILLTRFSPRTAMVLSVFPVALGIVYIVVSDLALTVFSVCFIQLNVAMFNL